jgi:dTDP-4-amino-4,6-dideoxygalactose transaminase
VVLRRVGRVPAERRPPLDRRLPNIDAAVALTLLGSLGRNLDGRRAHAAAYAARLRDVPGLRRVPHRQGSTCLTQLLVVAAGAPAATQLVGRLRAAGIEAGQSFTPLHLTSPARVGGPLALPVGA